MPRADLYRQLYGSGYSTLGQTLKSESNDAMEFTWDNNIQSKICYIYDYYHDDQPEINRGMTYDNTTKTRIDAKFIITSYGSIDKDQVAYHIMFKPSQTVRFGMGDDLYYFETDYRKKYDVQFPVGMMIDIPDEKDEYVKWLICDFEEANQFTKYTVLPCDYRLQWVSDNGTNRIKRQVWACTRSMNSYTAGTWIDRYFHTLDDVNKVILPLNPLTEEIGYLNEYGQNQRVIVSAKTKHPLTWQITKVENTKPIGLLKLTLDQDSFNPHTDYIEYDENGYIIGMWADYLRSNIIPDEDVKEPSNLRCEISTTNSNLGIGRGYKQLVCKIFDGDIEITDNYLLKNFEWSCFIGDEELTQSEIITWGNHKDANKTKIKFGDDRSYLDKLLTVKCKIDNLVGEIQLGLVV